MDPYQPPQSAPELKNGSGLPCVHCGSRDTTSDSLLNTRPNIFYFIIFGWFFILIRAAFSRHTYFCQDCGKSFAQKTVGSYVALTLLILLVLMIALSFFVDHLPAPAE